MAEKKKKTELGQIQSVNNNQPNQIQVYIQQQIGLANKQLIDNIYNLLVQEKIMTQTRQMAFERLLKQHMPWFNESVLADAVADVEDESSGFEKVSGPAQSGDRIRLEFQARGDDTDWSPAQKIAIHALGQKGIDDKVQTYDELEAALLNQVEGSHIELSITETFEGAPLINHFKATVKRVSRKKEEASK